MPSSLRDSIQQPAHTKAIIKLALRSLGGEKRVWCIVEAPDDVTIYQKFFDNKIVSILPSDDENQRRSCKNVESIVVELYKEENNPYVLGIRDCDYTRYQNSYSCPANVFVTDYRDIEMMMFGSSSVIEALKAWNDEFPQKIKACADVERYLGYLRIYNEIRQTSCSFHNKLTKLSLVWDFTTHVVKEDYKQNLFDKFKEECPMPVAEEDLKELIEEQQLEEEPDVNICRGHDMFNLLPAMMIRKEYNAKDIRIRMVEAYSRDDFSQTKLFADISAWAANRQLVILMASDR